MPPSPQQFTKKHPLRSSHIETPLGTMLAVADKSALYLLAFVDSIGLADDIARLEKKTGMSITAGITAPILSLQPEIRHYFAGTLTTFKTPIALDGTPFQKRVWQELQKIPYGNTCSYTAIATALGTPTACRAVARANSANQLALIVPCHRVINTNGSLGGYNAGIARKECLLAHEKQKSQ